MNAFLPKDVSGYKPGVCSVLLRRQKADKGAVQV